MRTIGSFVALAFLVASFGLAQDAKKEMGTTMHGYIVDAMCAKGMAKKDNPMEAAAKHTKSCALEEGCSASGYGVFSEGKYYKFDEAGDKMTKELIEKTKTEKGIMAEVSGQMKDDMFVVTSIKESMMEDKKMDEKKMDDKGMEKK